MTRYEMNEEGKVVKVDENEPTVERFPKPVTNRLFVYGIFLGESMRKYYGMSNPEYATVPGYITVGHHIVQAVPVADTKANIALTGLTVDVDPSQWRPLDQLEGGYQRKLVKTDRDEEVYMYVAPERGVGRF